MTLQVKMNLQGRAAIGPHHAHHGHHTSALWKGKMSIPSSSDESSSDDEGEGKPSIDELAEAIKFFQDVCTKQKAQLKTLKNKLISSQNDYKCFLEKFETFVN